MAHEALSGTDPLAMLSALVPELKESFNAGFVIPFGDTGFGITQYMLYAILVWIIVFAVVMLAGKRLTLVPNNKFVNMVEYGYQMVRNNIGEGTIGHGYKKHIPLLATLFFFILISNFIGLIPGSKAATGSLQINWALSIVAFVYFNYWGVKAHGGWGVRPVRIFVPVRRHQRRGRHRRPVRPLARVRDLHVRARDAGRVPASVRVHHPDGGVHQPGYVFALSHLWARALPRKAPDIWLHR